MPDRERKRWTPQANMGITGGLTPYTTPALAVDEAPSRDRTGKQRPPLLGRAERTFMAHLRKVADHVGHLIAGFEPGNIELVPTLTQLLRAYSDALKPWAEATVRRMLGEVNARDIDSWRSLSSAISTGLKRQLENTPVGATLNQLMHEQVGLIQSLPTDAADRVHRLTLQGLEDSTRANEIADEIERSGEVTRSRAALIAVTEVARTASVLTEARAVNVGLTSYIWRTARDSSVRPGHRAMEGKVCEWADPPAVNENGRIMHFHPGRIWRCRCYAEPVVPREDE